MWIYSQSSGLLKKADGSVFAQCYSGHGDGLNNPQMQGIHDVGPLPQGKYAMSALIDSPHTGRATVVLDPDPANSMFGRSGFRMHGDNLASNHTASDGCIIVPGIAARLAIWQSGDHELMVES